MSLITIKNEKPRRKRSWLRKLFWCGAALGVLLVTIYFVATSAVFLKGVVLPRVSNAISADVTLGEVDIGVFSHVVLRELKVHPRGSEPFLTVKEVRARYSLWSIIRGNIVVEEVAVESPVISVVQNADGTSNLDALLKLGSDKPSEPSAKSSKPPQVNVKIVALNNATVSLVKHCKGGAKDVTEISGLNFSVHDIKNGQSGKMELAASLAMDKADQPAVPGGSLRAKLGGGFDFALMADLMPASFKGNTTFTVEEATGAMAELNALAAKLDCEATPTEVKQLALRFAKGDVALGEVRVSGPLDTTKLEGKLKVEVLSLDRRVLNLAGAASGIDFGTTTINSTTDIEIAKAGSEISLGGRLDIAHFQIMQAGKTSPTLDVRCDYSVGMDNNAQSAVLKFLNLSGTQNSQLFLQSDLTSPMTIAWGTNGSAAGNATFNLSVTKLNLADWRDFVGEKSLAGFVNTKMKVVAEQGGKHLRLELNGGVEKFSANVGSNQVNQADVQLQARAQATELKQFKLEDFSVQVARKGEQALVVSASGVFDSATQDSDLQATAQVALSKLLAIFPQPDVSVSTGTVDFKSHIVGKDKKQSITGQLALVDFTGGQGNMHLARYGAALEFDAEIKDNFFELRKLSGDVRSGQNVGGRIEASGNLGVGAQVTGQIAVKLVDFNQDGLRPFLESALGDKKLVSISLNTTASVGLTVKGDTTIKADMQVANLVVSDPTNSSPGIPLQARVQVDASMAGQVAQLRQCQLTLTPTERGKNELNLTGNVDTSKPDAIAGSLKLAADTIDVTRYYELFGPKPQPPQTNAPAKTTKPAPTTQPAPAPAEPEKEPDPMTLPLQNFTFGVDINHFYLGEVDIANLQVAAKIDGGHIVLKPCQLKLNGAPVSAGVDADLSVPGYTYDVSFDAQSIPLAPLVNTFQPDRKGQIGGQLIANAQIKGAGITGENLQKNLAGQFSVLATNLNLSIADVRTPLINAIINTIVGLPEMISGLTGHKDSSQKMRWADELTAKPIDVVMARGVAGGGKVDVQEVDINSAAFRVQTGGELLLASVLTNSTLQFPVHVALGRPYAAKIGMVNSEIPTNALYVALPDFLTIKGTLESPAPEISKKGIAVLAGKTVGGIGKELGLAVGESGKTIYGGTKKLLFGDTSTTNSASASGTNGAAEPQKKGGLLNIFKKSKKE